MVSSKNFKYKKWAENQPTPTLDKEPIFLNFLYSILQTMIPIYLIIVPISNYMFSIVIIISQIAISIFANIIQHILIVCKFK